MDHTVHYNKCPICEGDSLKDIFSVRDHTVSNNEYLIVECNDCTLRLTQDVPDQAHIGDYYHSDNYISHTDSSKGLINWLYQSVRNITLKQKRRLVIRLSGKSKGSLLDLGSGTGSFASEMVTHGWKVTGLEPDAAARQRAKELKGVQLEDVNLFYSLPGSSFDIMTLWHVLEHVHELNGYFVQLKKLLRPDGHLLIAVPNYTSADAAHFRKHWAAYDVPRHLYHFSPASMKKLAEKHGLVIKRYRPMWYDSFYISLLSSRYKKGKTDFFGAFFAGLFSNLNALFNSRKCSSILYIVTHPS